MKLFVFFSRKFSNSAWKMPIFYLCTTGDSRLHFHSAFFPDNRFPSPSPTSILTQEQQEYFRISANIRAGNYDHVLEDIHDLYPAFTTDDVKLTNRFILLRLYYEKTGDRKKEKQQLLDYKKNKELYNDDAHLPIRQIITERLAALGKE